MKEKGIDMVVVNPAMVIGPLLQPTLNTSSAAVLSLVNGMFLKLKLVRSLPQSGEVKWLETV